MSFHLSFEALESRENPVGTGVSDPIGVGVVSPPPANVGSPDPTPTQPSNGTLSPSDIASQQILENTLAALGNTAW